MDVTFQAEESYPSVPRSGLFPLEVALAGAATGEGSSSSQPLIVGLIGGGLLALAILAALLLPGSERRSMCSMYGRLSWVLTAPLLALSLLAGHSLGYRWAVADPHARAHLLEESGHGYFTYAPLLIAVGFTLIAAALAMRIRAAARGDRMGESPPWVLALLPPMAFVVQELAERLLHSGHVHWATLAEPAVLIGLVLQLPLAVIALGLAWLLAQATDQLGQAIADRPRNRPAGIALPSATDDPLLPAFAVSTQGWSQRGPPSPSF